MQLQLSTWPEVEQYLLRSQGIIIPIGSTEQHGPTGLIGTDSLCAAAIAQGVGDRTEALVAPPIAVGMALHHLAFPGTLSLRPTTLIQVIQDYVTSLAGAGFRRFFFINGHGGNVATLKAAFAETYHYWQGQGGQGFRFHPDGGGLHSIRCHLANWYMGREVYGLAQQLYGDQEGVHATPSEVAVTQYLYPEAIKTADLAPLPAQSYSIYGSTEFRQRFPDGRMGSNPALATPDHGKQLYEVAVKEISDSYLNFLKAA
jgi:creatinine amidohydrolase